MSFNQLDSLYRQVIMDHFKNPRNKGVLKDSSLIIDMNNPTCGDRIELQLKIEDDKVTDVKFLGEGCSISLSSASMMTEGIKGLPVDEALDISHIFSQMMQGESYDEEKYDLGDLQALEGVRKFPTRIKCATLAWKAMEKGLKEQENN